ncbi:hypothetical protein EC973_005947 [Apophysomyces ossiformis]|uniref:Uncharacterized protein n=1 Tax=Apophysomyces ossiformis TaxID=679940 RepID=A0A8H7BWR8_9FUNG|nr:hypothetical protein EC973_005947 [Apophysomyces ossiformis]
MEKPKRFSFAGLTRSFSFSAQTKPTPPPTTATATASDDEERRKRRTQKSQSLYVKSFRHLVGKEDKSTNRSFDATEATQANSKEIRNSIRRSLSAVVYASPHSTSSPSDPSSTSSSAPGVMVPVLVTQEMSDAHGGLVMDEPRPLEEEDGKQNKKKKVEYDNSLEVMPEKDKKRLMIVWQGYGYHVNLEDENGPVQGLLEPQERAEDTMAQENLKNRFEEGIWTDYRGLIHPLHLFEPKEQLNDEARWTGLSVSELRRYYDNYGSMMLKIRESRMVQQQRQYHILDKQGKAEGEWIIPKLNEAESLQEVQVAA